MSSKLAVLALLLLVGTATSHDLEEADEDGEANTVGRTEAVEAAMEDALTQYLAGLTQPDIKRILRAGLPPFAAEQVVEQLPKHKSKGETGEAVPAVPDVAKAFARYVFKEVLQDFDERDVALYIHGVSFDEIMDEILEHLAGPLVDDIKKHTANAIAVSVDLLKEFVAAAAVGSSTETMDKIEDVLDEYQNRLENVIASLEVETGLDLSDSGLKSLRIEAMDIGKSRAMETFLDYVDPQPETYSETREEL